MNATISMAVPRLARPETMPVSLYTMNGYVGLHWYYKNPARADYWSFVTKRQAFVEWVDGGFSVYCTSCMVAYSRQVCDHVEFCSGGRSKATKLAQAITMGLV